jgi:hypothetical protein
MLVKGAGSRVADSAGRRGAVVAVAERCLPIGDDSCADPAAVPPCEVLDRFSVNHAYTLCVCVYVCECVCVCVCDCVYIYTRKHTHTYTYTLFVCASD